MICNKCNHSLPDDSEFCQYCGTKIEQTIENNIKTEKCQIDEKNDKQDVFLLEDTPNSNVAKKEKFPKKTYCRVCGSVIDNKTKKCTGCGKQHIRMIHIVILLVILVVFLISSVVAYKIGVDEGYQNGKSVNKNAINMSKEEYEDSKKKKENEASNSDWKESAQKILESEGYYDKDTTKTDTNNSIPVTTQKKSVNVTTKRTCLSAACENEVSGISSYCFEHKCFWPDCNFGRERGGYYCSIHTCNEIGCNNAVVANYKSYCESHTCYYPGCTSGQSFNSVYCLRHK